MPLLKRCCCCVTLRTGGITLGITTLALSLFSLVPASFGLVHRLFLARVTTHLVQKYGNDDDEAPEENMALWGTVTRVFKEGDVHHSELPPENDDRVVRLADFALIFFATSIAVLVVYAIFSILLMHGACRGRPRWFLLPWIVSTFLLLLAYIAGVSLSIWIAGSRWEIILLLAFAMIESAVGFYLVLCVVSLFQVLGSSEFLNGGGARDWEMKPRFSTTYNSVPSHER